MKRLMYVAGMLILIVAVGGCTARSYIATRERVDITVKGNQGVIYGPTPAPHIVANPMREVYTVDIELPTKDEVKAAMKKSESQPREAAPGKDTTDNNFK